MTSLIQALVNIFTKSTTPAKSQLELDLEAYTEFVFDQAWSSYQLAPKTSPLGEHYATHHSEDLGMQVMIVKERDGLKFEVKQGSRIITATGDMFEAMENFFNQAYSILA